MRLASSVRRRTEDQVETRGKKVACREAHGGKRANPRRLRRGDPRMRGVRCSASRGGANYTARVAVRPRREREREKGKLHSGELRAKSCPFLSGRSSPSPYTVAQEGASEIWALYRGVGSRYRSRGATIAGSLCFGTNTRCLKREATGWVCAPFCC